MSTGAPSSAGPAMRDIADRAGVGKATVSLALRDDPRLRVATRRRIQRLAAKMGYRPNATVANLMAQLRATRSAARQAAIALVEIPSPPGGSRAIDDLCHGCRERAAQLGYSLERIRLDAPQASLARQIRGAIFLAPASHLRFPDGSDLLWRRLPSVVAGARPANPGLNFSASDQFAITIDAFQRLWDSGARRIGLVISREADSFAGRRYSAGFWSAQQAFDGWERLTPFTFSGDGEDSFRAWHTHHRPDAILTLHPEIKGWLERMGVQIPALTHLDWHDQLTGWSGMNQNRLLAGAAAVDMLVAQIYGNEIGVPIFQKASLVPGLWIDAAPRRSPRKQTRGLYGVESGAGSAAADGSVVRSVSVGTEPSASRGGSQPA